MIKLCYFPNNKDKYVRLIEFFKEVLDICNDLNIDLMLDGSLAVFAYTEDQAMDVNDIDLACSETEFPRIIRILEERGISYKLREWRVLQVLKDDLKVELDSMEYWYKGLLTEYEPLQIDNYKVKMLSLNSLKEFYRQGIKDRASNMDENERIKYEALKAKIEMLEKITG